MGPQPPQVPCRGGPYGPRVLAPDERDGPDRRPPRHHRPRPRLLADTTVADLVRESGAAYVKVVTPEAARLRELLSDAPGVEVTGESPDTLHIRGTDAPHVGRTAATHGIPLFELTPQTASLEQAFMDLTHDSVEYQATAMTGAAA